MNSSLYAIIKKFTSLAGLIGLIATALVIVAEPARANTQATVGLNPVAIALDSSGNAYTANSGDGTVSKVDGSGSVQTLANLSPAKPSAIAISPAGNIIVGSKAGLLYSISPTGLLSTLGTVGKNPIAIVFDSSGNLYTANNTDSSVSKLTPSGQVSLFARVATWPSSMTIDSQGNLFTTSYLDGMVSKITATGVVTSMFATVSDYPTGIAVDANNNLYVTNSSDNTISKISANGQTSHFATVGKKPAGLVIDKAGNLYTANSADNTVSKVSASGLVSTFAITGNSPVALALNATGILAVANNMDSSITVIKPNASYPAASSNLQGSNLTSTSVELSWTAPNHTTGTPVSDYLVEAVSNNGKDLIGSYRVGSANTTFTFPGLCSLESYQLRVYAINSSGLGPASNSIAFLLPPGPAAAPINLSPALIRGTSISLAWEAPSCLGGSAITDYRISYSSDAGENWTTATRAPSSLLSHTVNGLVLGRNYLFRIASVNASGVGSPSVPLALSTAESTTSYTVGSEPAAMVLDNSGNLYVANTLDNTISKITSSGVVSRFASVGDNPSAMTFDAAGNLYVANADEGTISKVTPAGVVSLFATVGDRPSSLAFDGLGNLYVADSLAGNIYKINSQALVTVFADGLANPTALVFDSAGNLFSANGKNSTVSKISATGQVSLFATLPIQAGRVITDTAGNFYVFSNLSSSVYKLSPTGAITLFATFSDAVTDFVVDSQNNIYVANSTDGTISKVNQDGKASIMAISEDTIVRILSDARGNLFTSYAEGKVVKSVMGKIASAPRNLSSGQITENSVELSWLVPQTDGQSALMNYRVESSLNGEPWSVVQRSASTATSFRISGLAGNSDYSFRVAAINGLGQSAYSNTVSAKTLSAVPSAVRNLAASNISSDSLTLSWLAPSNNGGQPVTNYLVEYSETGSIWMNITKPVNTSTELLIGSLAPAKTYRYRVIAVSSVGASAPSESVTVTTMPAAPGAPSQLVANSITQTSLSLNWLSPNLTNGSPITNYKITISRDSGATWSELPRIASTSTTQQVTGLTAGKSYLFRVQAINSVGVSAASVEKTFQTQAINLPAAPSLISFINTKATSTSISWSPVAGSGKITAYQVEVSRGGENWLTVPNKIPTTTSLSVGNLNPGINYQVRVAARNADGLGSYKYGQFTTLATLSTSPVSLSSSAVSSSGFTLTWLAPSSNGGAVITDYVVEVNGGGLVWAPISHSPSSLTSIQVSGLNPVVKYGVRVKAINSAGVSKASSVFYVTTLPTLPGTPTGLNVKTNTSAATTISWLAPASGGSKISDYLVEYSTDNGVSWKSVSKTVSATTSLAIKGLKS